MTWKKKHWTEDVQRVLTPYFKGGAKKRRIERTPAFNRLKKAAKWIQYFPDIQEFEKQFDYFEYHVEDKDEDEDDEDEDEDDDDDEDDEDEDEDDDDEHEKEVKEQWLKLKQEQRRKQEQRLPK
jgi:hypothetical protein